MKKQYTLFIGLNDQTTKMQEISTLDAYKIVSNLCVKYVGFGTITEAMGVYTHENGEIVQETTLKVEFIDVDLEGVKKVAKAAKIALNQESIAFKETVVEFDFI